MARRGRLHRGGNARHGQVDLRLHIDVVPLAHLDLVHAPHEEEDAMLGDLHDGEIGARGGRGRWGGRGPQEALAVAGDLSSWDFPSVDQVLWVGKGVVGRVGLCERGAAQALFADAPEAIPAAPPS